MIKMEEKKEEIKLVLLETGLLWPYHNNKKALSANYLTKLLKEDLYKEIPQFVLMRAAQNGKNFHQAVQDFLKSNIEPSFINKSKDKSLSKVETKIIETINFLREEKISGVNEIEKLYYVFHKGELLASYVDLVFDDYIIELKSSNFRGVENPLTLLIFEIQLLIQTLCTKKKVYLLWSTGEGVIFEKFQLSDKLLKILDILIDFSQGSLDLVDKDKQNIIDEITNLYSPNRVFTKKVF
jgi:hypothetical protein